MRRKLRVLLLAALLGSVATLGGTATTGSASSTSANPADWKLWHLTAASQFRPSAPPAAGSRTTKAELRQLKRLQRKRTAKIQELVRKWNGTPAAAVWTDVALQMIRDYRPRPPFSARILALLETGMYDAMVAAADASRVYARNRPAPSKLDPSIKPLVKGAHACVPPEAAIAGAAEKLLAYLFPAEPTRTFTALATQAVNSRLYAGTNYRGDLQSARALGQKVAAVVIAYARADRSNSTGFSEGPFRGEEFWVTSPPSYEGAVGGPVGKWKPWLLKEPGSMRHVLPGPSKYGPPQFMAQLQKVLDTSFKLTPEQKQIADFWDDRPGTNTPPGHWVAIALQLIKAYKTPPAQAARILALLGTVEADSVIAAWEAKYHWWSIRPITAIWRLCDGGGKLCTEAEVTAQPSRATYRNRWYSYITTPPFPAYPSGHAAFSGGGARLLGHFYPKARASLNALADQAALSRLLGGIHFEEDNRDGLLLGRAVADLAIARAVSDGSG
ncbi:MAG: hypothetical protein ABR521_10760 [Gaiellaceae bacterium]